MIAERRKAALPRDKPKASVRRVILKQADEIRIRRRRITRSLYLPEQFGGATSGFRQLPQRLASAGGVGRRRAQQFAQLRRGARIDPAPCAPRQTRDPPELLLAHRVVPFREHECRHLEKSESGRLGAEQIYGL